MLRLMQKGFPWKVWCALDGAVGQKIEPLPDFCDAYIKHVSINGGTLKKSSNLDGDFPLAIQLLWYQHLWKLPYTSHILVLFSDFTSCDFTIRIEEFLEAPNLLASTPSRRDRQLSAESGGRDRRIGLCGERAMDNRQSLWPMQNIPPSEILAEIPRFEWRFFERHVLCDAVRWSRAGVKFL